MGVTIVGQAKVLWFATRSVCVFLLLFCTFCVCASFVAFVVVVFVVIYAMEMRKLFGAHIYIFGWFYARPFLFAALSRQCRLLWQCSSHVTHTPRMTGPQITWRPLAAAYIFN